MASYELTNNQRWYFGLLPVQEDWERVLLNDSITVYYQGDKIVKVLDYSYGYSEYDTDVETKARETLLPKTSRGKEQKLTVPRLLKIKGSGVWFSGSFRGGGITVYDNKRNLCFLKSFVEQGDIKSFDDIDNWIGDFIRQAPDNYFEWLNKELSQKRVNVKVKEGDIIAFRISPDQFGFARILADVFSRIQQSKVIVSEFSMVHPRSLVIASYAYYADTLQINIDELVSKKTLPSIFIFDLDVYRGEMPIVGHRPLSANDKQISFPEKRSTFLTIPYSKTDIEMFIASC
jgi:hypothetical protein